MLIDPAQSGAPPYTPPFGARCTPDGCHFHIYSHSAQSLSILLYRSKDDRDPFEIIELSEQHHKHGDIWHRFIPGLRPGTLYHYQADGPFRPDLGHWFDPNARLIDPYSDALAGDFLPSSDGVIRPPKSVVIDHNFDWQSDKHPKTPLRDTILYELHVAGFTKSPTSHVTKPGTYLGLIEKIPYLLSLGITAVELMPIHEFPILHFHGSPFKHPNYWGYDPMAFFAPHRGYAYDPSPGAQVHEFKQLVREMHRAGIEVILDVVLNHTCEGNERGPVLSMKGLENSVYYLMTNQGSHYCNFSGCGNTFNSNHPVCRELICHCLRHWVLNYHVDGFRFDLASILSRDRNGNLSSSAPILEWIAEDPVLADSKLIAEAWDAAGTYQVGAFGTGHGLPCISRRWSEWNGRFRDDTRRFWRADPHTAGPFATRLCGSSDLYEPHGRTPENSINFITSHDGFTLNDLVSYSTKHNEENGEDNRDGDNNNLSQNLGVEGPATKKTIERVRLRQIKNFLATLLLSQGVPMLSMGDEARRTQRGNNNAYCQDNEISWMDWSLVESNQDLVRFTQSLIQLRKIHPALRRTEFFAGNFRHDQSPPDINWFDLQGNPLDWQQTNNSLACSLTSPTRHSKSHPTDSNQTSAQTSYKHADTLQLVDHSIANRDLLILFNPTTQNLHYRLPENTTGSPWRLFFDTSKSLRDNLSPDGLFPDGLGPVFSPNPRSKMMNRSMMLWISSD